MSYEELESFKEDYESFFIERFIYSSAELEDFYNSNDKREMLLDLLEAYRILMSKSDMLTLGDILKVGNLVNKSHGISPGFRKIEVTAGEKADFIPAEPSTIPMKLNELLYFYYTSWSDLDVFLKEAIFHIKYMHIHPFEDGNKRSGKLILTTNLCKQGYPPIIITKEDISEYYAFINGYDYEGFAEFLRQRSQLENNTMCGFYKSKNGIPVYEDIDFKSIQKILVPKRD